MGCRYTSLHATCGRACPAQEFASDLDLWLWRVSSGSLWWKSLSPWKSMEMYCMTRSYATMLDLQGEDETTQACDNGCKHFTRSVRTSREVRVSGPHLTLCRQFANSLRILGPRATSNDEHLQSTSEINRLASNTPRDVYPAARLSSSKTVAAQD